MPVVWVHRRELHFAVEPQTTRPDTPPLPRRAGEGWDGGGAKSHYVLVIDEAGNGCCCWCGGAVVVRSAVGPHPSPTLPRRRGRGPVMRSSRSTRPCNRHPLSPAYTASDNDVNVKSRSFIGGIIIAKLDSSPLTRIGLPSSSMLLSMITGDSLKRKFFSGYLISPFSM